MWFPPHRMDHTSRFVICGQTIERQHWLRDMDFGEDRSRVRSGQAPRLLAALRNAILTLFGRVHRPAVATARRYFASHPRRAVSLIRRSFHSYR